MAVAGTRLGTDIPAILAIIERELLVQVKVLEHTECIVCGTIYVCHVYTVVKRVRGCIAQREQFLFTHITRYSHRAICAPITIYIYRTHYVTARYRHKGAFCSQRIVCTQVRHLYVAKWQITRPHKSI